MNIQPIASNPPRRRMLAQLLAGTAVVAGGGLLWNTSAHSEEGVRIPAPASDPPVTATGLQKAVFAGGCFWGVQGVFQHVKGVKRAVSGYAGGTADSASYDTVSGGRTGHAESVEVSFDPTQVSYGTLLQVFFSVAHDPTQLNRQGPDSGTQYRSAIFATNAAQLKTAQDYVAQLDAAKVFSKPIVTKLESNKPFYPAEAYHQDFLTENPRYPYIVINDLPKIENLKKIFPQQYRSDPVLVKQSRGNA